MALRGALSVFPYKNISPFSFEGNLMLRVAVYSEESSGEGGKRKWRGKRGVELHTHIHIHLNHSHIHTHLLLCVCDHMASCVYIFCSLNHGQSYSYYWGRKKMRKKGIPLKI